MAVVFYDDHESPVPSSVEMLPWGSTPEGSELPGVLDLFAEHEVTDCVPCPGGQKCRKKFSTAFSPIKLRVPYREDGNVESVSFLVYDEDHITRAELEALCGRLEGLECFIASTHSHLHGGPDDNCVRIGIPLERALTPSEFQHVYHEVRRRYQLDWLRPGATKPSGADPSAKNISRLYFLPTSPRGAETIVGHESGALLDLDELLRSFTPEPPKPVYKSSSGPIPTTVERAVDMDELRRVLRAYVPKHKEKDDGRTITRKELARRVEAGEVLVRPDETGLREDSCHRIGKILAHCLPEGTPKEAVLELVRPSIMALPFLPSDGEDDTHEARFKKVGYSFERGLLEKEQQKEVNAAKKAESDRLRDGFRKRFSVRREVQSKVLAGDLEPEDEEAEEHVELTKTEVEEEEREQAEFEAKCEGWEELLEWNEEKENKKGEKLPRTLKNIDSNVQTILAYAPMWRRVLRYNEVTKDILVVGGPLNDYENTPSQVTTGVKYWLQHAWNLNLRKNEVMDAIVHVAKMNAFDPVKKYLNRIEDVGFNVDMFLEDYCGAQTVDADEKDITKLVRRMSRCFLVGAVARGLQPGCKMDTVLILEGLQGVKKSTMLDVLGGAWFTDSPIVIGDKDSKMLAGRSWIAELAELSAMHASAVEQQKAFFSARVDKFRPPYGYAIEEFLRRCVFAGSTNDEQYMNDITGNRRYHPVKCARFEVRRARRDRDKIWAAAVTIFKSGGAENCTECAAATDEEDRCYKHRWWFTPVENRELEKTNNQRLKNEFAEAITDYLLKLDPPPPESVSVEERAKMNVRPQALTMYEIATQILGLSPDRVNAQQGPIGRALKSLGFMKTRTRVNGILQSWQHVLPPQLLAAPKRVRGRHLHVVPNDMSAPPDMGAK